MSGMFGESRAHPAHKSVEWYTPAWVFDELRLEFDLDPSSPHDMACHVPADTVYTVFDDGLKRPWHGRVWLNPPYGRDIGQWMRRMIDHRHGVAMVFSRTDAKWCQESMQTCDAMLFLAGRVAFVPGRENAHKKAGAGAGTVMFAWGQDCAQALARLAPHGFFVRVQQGAEARLDRGVGSDAAPLAIGG